MSCFEFFLSSKFVKLGSNIIISFCIESDDIAKMPHRHFQSHIVLRKKKMIGIVATLLKVKYEQIERLKPTKLSNGAMFVFTVASGDDKYNQIKQTFEELVQDDIFLKVYTICLSEYSVHISTYTCVFCLCCFCFCFFQGFESIYKIKIIAIKDFVVERLRDLYPDNTKKSVKNSLEMGRKFVYVPSGTATPRSPYIVPE